MKKARVIAFYLPQYHPIPENDIWWGKGFTEWTNVAKAKPLFKGHYQPKIPTDLGFYDLRLPEIREAQAKLASDAGIEGFCYWHYWFGNEKRLLERPFNEVLVSGQPNFPFCLAWANHSWSNKTWEKSNNVKSKILIEQTYSKNDYINHFYYVLEAFKDKRYIQVDGKPLFIIFDPLGIPDTSEFLHLWRDLAIQNGLKGIHFVGITHNFSYRRGGERNKGEYTLPNIHNSEKLYRRILNIGFDAVNSRGYIRAELIVNGICNRAYSKLLNKVLNINSLSLFDYKEIIRHLFVDEDKWETVYPTLLPNWDRSPRSGKLASIYIDCTPNLFEKHIANALQVIEGKEDEHKILFLQSWNEWAEGNYVEPDIKYGCGYLETLAKLIK